MLFPNQVNLFQVTLFYPLPKHTHTHTHTQRERERQTDRQTDRQTGQIGNNGKAEIIDVIFS